MRLICPNCGAQYEVPDNVIPEGGRDVQCSNCGNTWFQQHPDQDAELAEELDQPLAQDDWTEEAEARVSGDAYPRAPDSRGPDPRAPDSRAAAAMPEAEARVAAPPPPADPVPTPVSDPVSDPVGTLPEDDPEQGLWDAAPADRNAPLQPVPGAGDDLYDDEYEAWDDDGPLPAPPPPQPRRIDPGIADLFREEAEREARQRAAARGALETQPELGLTQGTPEDEAQRRQREAQERMARLRGDMSAPETDPVQAVGSAAALAAAATRRGLLPDIDQINSTLRATTERRPATAADHDGAGSPSGPTNAAPGGFRRGFVLALALACCAGAVYLMAAQITASVPALAPALDGYVARIDGARIWLDGQMQALLLWLDSLSSEGTA